jgi:hypothetical protein
MNIYFSIGGGDSKWHFDWTCQSLIIMPFHNKLGVNIKNIHKITRFEALLSSLNLLKKNLNIVICEVMKIY